MIIRILPPGEEIQSVYLYGIYLYMSVSSAGQAVMLILKLFKVVRTDSQLPRIF